MEALGLNEHVLVLLRDMKGPAWEVNTLAAKQSMTKGPYNEQHAMAHHALSGCGHGGDPNSRPSLLAGMRTSKLPIEEQEIDASVLVQIGYKWESIRSKWGYDYL